MKKNVIETTGVAPPSTRKWEVGFARLGGAPPGLARLEVQHLPCEGRISNRRPLTRARVVRTMLVVLALTVAAGCSAFRGRNSGKSWNQTAAKEQREQEIGASAAGDWDSALR